MSNFTMAHVSDIDNLLAFCRSGTRSIVSWSLGEKDAGGRSREDLIGLGHAAGYDLSQVI